ncbi:type II toxin-antitoxin system Phd/YefM family antitoxin [Profundibacterium mesophilum]
MWTLHDAKNRFSAVVAAAVAGTPQEVSRRGKPAVIVLSVEQYTRLSEAARRDAGSFSDHLRAFPVPGDARGRAGDETPDAAAPAPRAQARPRDVHF